MKEILKRNIKIVIGITVALALLPLTFNLVQGSFQFMLMINYPIISGIIAFASILLSIKINSYLSQKQRIGLCLFYLLLPFSFFYNLNGITFILIKFQPAIALGYFGTGLALVFNTFKINRTANKA